MHCRQPNCSAFTKFWLLAIIFVSIFGGIAIWRYHQRAALTARESDQLIRSLAASISAHKNSLTVCKTAIFDAGSKEVADTERLISILSALPVVKLQTISPESIRLGELRNFDVVIFPGGSAPKQSAALGDNGKQAVRDFVQFGGGYVGICAGAFLATAKYEYGLALVNAKPLTGKLEIPGRGIQSMATRDAGAVKIKFTAKGQNVLEPASDIMTVKFGGGPILLPANMPNLMECVPLAIFRTEVWDYEPQKGTMINTPAIVAGRFGSGRVVIFSPHPELTDGLEVLVQQAVLATARSRVANEPFKADSLQFFGIMLLSSMLTFLATSLAKP